MSELAGDQLTTFQQWMLQVFTALGTTASDDIDPVGMEFNAGGHLARVLPHADDALAVAEVDVMSLANAPDLTLARVAIMMLRLNDDARFEHGWQIVLNDDDSLCISSTLVMQGTSADGLADMLQDGVDRANALAGSVQAAMAVMATDAPAGGAPDHAHLVRG